MNTDMIQCAESRHHRGYRRKERAVMAKKNTADLLVQTLAAAGVRAHVRGFR